MCRPLYFILLVLCVSVKAQEGYLIYRTISSKDAKYRFPLFIGKGENVRKINRLLQLGELEMLKGYEKRSIFEEVTIDDGTFYGGLVNLGYRIYNNTSKILSIRLDEASCGITCHYWRDYKNFNPGNGDLIQLQDLFTEEGYASFQKYAAGKRVAEFRKQRQSKDEGLGDILACYEEDGEFSEFYLSGRTLYIDGDGWLNDYGRAVFGLTDESVDKFRSKRLPQLFAGTVGTARVYLVIRTGYKHEVYGEYAYLKYGRGIFLEGQADSTRVGLAEKLRREEKPGGYFDVQLDERGLSGVYWSAGDAKEYPVLLKRL